MPPAAGMMLDCIQEVFDVTGLQLFALDKPAAAEFLEVYKGVVAPGEFTAMVDELVAGPSIAVEVSNTVPQYHDAGAQCRRVFKAQLGRSLFWLPAHVPAICAGTRESVLACLLDLVSRPPQPLSSSRTGTSSKVACCCCIPCHGCCRLLTGRVTRRQSPLGSCAGLWTLSWGACCGQTACVQDLV